MQGLPINLLTQNAAASAVKVEGILPAGANGKMVEGAVTNSEDKNMFASLFSGMIGAPELPAGMKKGEGKTESKISTTAETTVDALLKNKDQEKNIKTEVTVLSNEKALPAEVLKNIDNLLAKTPLDASGKEIKKDEKEISGPITEKVTVATNGLDQLLKTLKDQKEGNIEVELEGVKGDTLEVEAKGPKKIETGSTLDFLLKESKGKDVGSATPISRESLLKENPEVVSKLGISSEDFLSQLGRAQAKTSKEPLSASKTMSAMNTNGEFVDANELLKKSMNQSMKTYGQKQEMLNGNVIKSAKDLAAKDNKSKNAIDELKNPDLKIAADLSSVKDPMVPLMQKQESQPQVADTQNSGKVLDLSKINTSNTNEIIKRISDYVEQNQVANKESLDLTVKHDSLGQFKIQVNKPMGPGANQMDMQITTSTQQGHDFFVKNEIGLMKNLSQAGVQLSDLRIVSGGESMSFSHGDSRQSGNNQSAQGPREFMSFENGDSSQGSQRRRELWQEAKANQQRYGA